MKMLMDEFGDASTLSQFQGGFNSAPSSDIAPPDPELQSEILELLSIFQAVHDNKSAIDTRSLLKKCIYMCERIMQRYYRLPDVVAIHEQAKALLQMFESVGPESPFARSNVSSNFATGNSTLSGPRSFRNNLLADVKEALDRVDRDAKESGDSKVRPQHQSSFSRRNLAEIIFGNIFFSRFFLLSASPGPLKQLMSYSRKVMVLFSFGIKSIHILSNCH